MFPSLVLNPSNQLYVSEMIDRADVCASARMAVCLAGAMGKSRHKYSSHTDTMIAPGQLLVELNQGTSHWMEAQDMHDGLSHN